MPEPITLDPPFRIPRPVIRQSWFELTFLHWPFPPEAVRPLLPPGLELDLWEGKAYVGLVPFILSGLTHPSAPTVPWLSHFNETNVRTYVYDAAGRRGVWFFSLDAARLAAVIGARAAYALPYYWARMSVDAAPESVHYVSTRRHGPPGITDIAIVPGAAIPEPSPLEGFLTARWRLFAYRRQRLLVADVDHPRWPLQRATVSRLDETLIQAAGLPRPTGEPLVHFSKGTTVLTSWPRPVAGAPTTMR